MKKNTRNASGGGTLYKRVKTKGGKTYTYWEGRITIGRDPGTGKQIRQSFSGKTQKEVREKMSRAVTDVDSGIFISPCDMTVGEWLDLWSNDYLGGVKPTTAYAYTANIRNNIKPYIGAVQLESLTPHIVQDLYNKLMDRGLSAKTVKNCASVLHKSLQQAVKNQYIRQNPCDACELPRVQKKEIRPLNEAEIGEFLKAIKGDPYCNLFQVALFTGMRRGELLGLQWADIDWKAGTILIHQQLQLDRKSGEYVFTTLKNDKPRKITPSSWVMDILKRHYAQQCELRLSSGDRWQDSGLVFTDKFGRHLMCPTVYTHFKKIASSIGLPDARFHDLRHTYAVSSIRAGIDIKTISSTLGHATVAFTLDIYGHVTDEMLSESSRKMDAYIHNVLNL